MLQRLLITLAFAASLFSTNCAIAQKSSGVATRSTVDTFIDLRHDAPPTAIQDLLKKLERNGVEDMQTLEAVLRAPRASYPNADSLVGKYTTHVVSCLHVDYSSSILLYVPRNYRPDKASSLVIVGHGGNSSMSETRAVATAKAYLQIYAPPIARDLNAIVVAPASTRGWGHIGNSLILSTISKLQRMFPIDPDRIYITGQSMGGHLSYRAALTLPDRWGAVSPHSGGYNYVEKKAIRNLINVPGYVTFGAREPYGINTDNRINAKWGKEHGLDWTFVEKNGGHEIYRDELPKVAAFFKSHPRDLYRKTVYFRAGGAMKFERTWQVKGWPKHVVHSDTRPLRWNMRHWIQVEPRTDSSDAMSLTATNLGNNKIEITSDGVRKLTVFLHPRMVDFNSPVSVTVNGKQLHNAKPMSDPAIMFQLAQEFDDRGRVYWSKLQVDIDSDQEITLD